MTLIDGFILFVYYLMRQCVVHVNLLEHLICIGDVTVNSSTCTCDSYPLSSRCGFAFSLSLPCVSVGVGVTNCFFGDA